LAVKKIRKLHIVAKELKLASSTLTQELEANGYQVTKAQMTPITDEMYEELLKKFAPDLWTSRQEEIAKQKAEEKELQAQKVRHEDLQKILDTGGKVEPRKASPSVRQMDPELLKLTRPIEKLSPEKIITPVKEMLIPITAKIEPVESQAELPIVEEKPAKRPLERVKPAPPVQEAASQVVKEFAETEAELATLTKQLEREPREKLKEEDQLEEKKAAPLSVRGAVSNEDILVFTPTPTPREAVSEIPEFDLKKQILEEETDEDEIPRSKKKRKRKRKAIKAETEQIEAPVKSSDWMSGDDSLVKRRKKRDRKKKKKVDVKEVQASIRHTMAAMEDHSRKRKRRHIAHDIGIVDEEIKLIKVTEFISTTDLASLIDVPVNDLIRECLMLGLRVTINQRLEQDTIQLLAEEHGYQVEFVDRVIDEEFVHEEYDAEEESLLEPHAPVVTVMGHVDHGKTSLLDYIRHTRVVEGEVGGITQHIGAYEVEHNNKKITFLDTPGHAAFTAMRARGAQVTDIVVLVIAADDQVMPQTIEAIDHSKAAGVPIVVAINKMDKPGANPDKVRRQLSEHNIIVEQYGGEVLNSEISAKTGKGIDDLLDKILLTTEMLELKANPHTLAKGVVIESRLDKGRGTVCTVLVEKGTLRIGDVFVAGPYLGRVRAMFNERGIKRSEAGPAQPVEIIGFEAAPHVGDHLVVHRDEREAKEIAIKRQLQLREQEMRLREGFKGALLQTIEGEEKQMLYLIVKGDVDGSVEAIADSLMRLSTKEVEVKIIHRSVGPINESDVLLASASHAMIIGFNVHPNLNAREMAQRESVEFKTYRVIYELIEDVRQILTGMYRHEFRLEVAGTAEVRNIFKISRIGVIAGCMMVNGKVERSNKVRIIRDGIEIYQGELESLRRFKDDAKEVVQGFECGIKIANFNDIKVGDLIEALVEVEVEREIVLETQ